MFVLYLISIFIWFALIVSYLCVASMQIADNGWVDGKRGGSAPQAFISLLITCAIPILRAIFLCVVIYMATHTKEEFEEEKKKYYGDDD